MNQPLMYKLKAMSVFQGLIFILISIHCENVYLFFYDVTSKLN